MLLQNVENWKVLGWVSSNGIMFIELLSFVKVCQLTQNLKETEYEHSLHKPNQIISEREVGY